MFPVSSLNFTVTILNSVVHIFSPQSLELDFVQEQRMKVINKKRPPFNFTDQ